jgi:transcriptional regulator with XRE-family HTH domain
METMGQKLVGLRQAKSLSQEALAKAAGLSQTTVSRLEKGEQVASTQTLAKLARALGTSLADLVPQEALNASDGDGDIFHAFCANAFCVRNKMAKKDGRAVVYWESWQPVPAQKWADVNFCRSCGNDLVKECPGCSKRMTEKGGLFCVRCGEKLTKRPTSDEWKKINEQLETEFDDDIPF